MADEDLFLPRPVGLVADRHQELQTAYVHQRSSMEPVESLTAAIHRVFTPAESADIISFANGEQDRVFGAGSGETFVPMLLGNLEQLYQQMRELGLA